MSIAIPGGAARSAATTVRRSTSKARPADKPVPPGMLRASVRLPAATETTLTVSFSGEDTPQARVAAFAVAAGRTLAGVAAEQILQGRSGPAVLIAAPDQVLQVMTDEFCRFMRDEVPSNVTRIWDTQLTELASAAKAAKAADAARATKAVAPPKPAAKPAAPAYRPRRHR